jgi:signal peptidase
MTWIRRAIDLALGTLVLAVLIIGLSAQLAPLVGGRVFAIRTGSMEPKLPVGALVVSSAVKPQDLVAGDTITISLGSGTVLTHRVAAVVQQDGRRLFQLKGDANPAPDPVLVVPDQILGRVAFGLPLLGYLLAMLSMPSGIAALLSIGAMLLIAGWLLDELEDSGADAGGGVEREARQRLDGGGAHPTDGSSTDAAPRPSAGLRGEVGLGPR